MMEMKIKIEVPDLAAAVEKLAAALSNSAFMEKLCTQGTPAPAAVTAPAPAVPVAPPVPPADPVTSAPTAPAVPVTAPAYNLDQIAKAGASLVDAGKMEQLLQLLGRYGVQAVTQIRPDQYGAFATELRALGAQI